MICDSLKTLAEARSDWIEKTGLAIARLIDVASRLEFQNSVESLTHLKTKLESESFQVVGVGRYKVSKSTLINALLNPSLKLIPELRDNPGSLSLDCLPSTGRLTRIRYADDPYVYAWKDDGQRDKWSLARYLHT